MIFDPRRSKKHPNRVNIRKTTPGHIIITLLKNSAKEKILKAASEKRHIIYREIIIRVFIDFSLETVQAKRKLNAKVQNTTVNLEFYTQQDETETFSDKQIQESHILKQSHPS